MSKKKICVDDDQVTRLMTDTAKLAQGRDDDICPTVRDMYDEHVKIEPKKRKGKKESPSIEETGAKAVTKHITKKAQGVLDYLFG